jgi:hypothetical protein
MDDESSSSENQPTQSFDISNILGIRRNVYAKNLSRIIYLSSETNQFKASSFEKDLSGTGYN